MIDDYTRIGGFVLNKDSSVTPVEIETYLGRNGPITIYGGVDLEVDLSSRLSGQTFAEGGRGRLRRLRSRVPSDEQRGRGLLVEQRQQFGWSGGSWGRQRDQARQTVEPETMIREAERSRSEEAITEAWFRPRYSSSNAQPGVKLGTTTANHTQIYSGGGNISIKGSSTATGLGDDRDEAGITSGDE